MSCRCGRLADERAGGDGLDACVKLRTGDTRGLARDDQDRRVAFGILLNDDAAGMIDRALRPGSDLADLGRRKAFKDREPRKRVDNDVGCHRLTLFQHMPAQCELCQQGRMIRQAGSSGGSPLSR